VDCSADSEFGSYRHADELLQRLIRGERYASRSAATRRQRAEIKLSRVREMLNALGDPQRAYPVVHVTGTSGKGSTAAAVAAILTAAGYRVGLRTSPYLQVATEKLQLGHALIDARSLARLVSGVLNTAARLFPPEQTEPPISYAEVWSVLGYWWFAERGVDIAVVEVGAGGRFDATNVIDPIVSVITSVGLDHLVTLGPTIADIAWHKAGIIKPGASVVIGELPAQALAVISEEAKTASADLFRAGSVDASLPRLTPVPQGFQEHNANVAATVGRVLGQRGFGSSEAAISTGIGSARLPGRLERMPETLHPAVWIDGAHNEDKIRAVTREAVRLSGGGPLPVVVFGMLRSKDPSSMLAKLGSAASSIVLTEPSVHGRQALAADTLAEDLNATGFAGPVHVEPEPDAAVRCADAIARRDGAWVLVMGSMYLAGQVRRRWFRDQDIVLQRTPWPRVTPEGSLGPTRPLGGLVSDKADGERDQTADHQESAGTDQLVVW
jgi:dihydrofolate synthase / folylpolyglutamate synthase